MAKQICVSPRVFQRVASPLSTDMVRVFRRKQEMVDSLVELHLERFHASGVELMMGAARFLAEKMVEMHSSRGGARVIEGRQVFLSVGTRATIQEISGLEADVPLTHVEALELDRVPEHLTVLGSG